MGIGRFADVTLGGLLLHGENAIRLTEADKTKLIGEGRRGAQRDATREEFAQTVEVRTAAAAAAKAAGRRWRSCTCLIRR